LVFETQKLEEILKIEAERFWYDRAHISDLIHSDDERKFKEELSPRLHDIAEFVEKIFLQKKHNEKEARRVYSSFVHCISRYKHYCFKEENEVRIFMMPTIQDEDYLRRAKKEGVTLKPEKERKFRSKNGQLIPYIVLFNSTDIVLPIERIIV